MATPSTSQPAWASCSGLAPGLAGISCRMELRIANDLAGVMLVEESGEVRIVGDGEAATMIVLDSHETLVRLLRGELAPIVAHLQGLLRFEGDADLALRVLFGLQAGSPWTELLETGEAQ